MPGCNVTRRDMLRWTAFAIAGAGVGGLARPWPVMGQTVPHGAIVPTNLELVTLTEDTAVLTWYTGHAGSDDGLGRMEPAPTQAEVAWGTDPNRLDQTAGSTSYTPYHRVEITGLEPGRTYYYQPRSAGRVVAPTEFNLIEGDAANTGSDPTPEGGPYRFTTPMPPPGRFLFSLVLCNDLHLGETVAGLVGDLPGIQGISQVPGERPYPTVMTEALVAEAAELGAAHLLAAGDITAEAEPDEVTEARELLERFGRRQSDWFAARGNHDRAHEGAEWSTCSVGRWQGHDCFADQFFPRDEPTWFAQDLNGLRVVGLDTYDKPGSGGDAGELSDDQMAWLRDELAADAERPTIVFGHHPLLVEQSPYPVTGGSALDEAQAGAIVDAYRAAPGLFLHHAGHSHRNHRSDLPGLPGVVHQEVAAVKEYPGGFSLLRVHSGGYALNFHKLRSDEARAWSERSRMQIAGTWPQFALGSRVADRNLMVERDLSGLGPAPVETSTEETSARATEAGSDGGLPPAVVAGAGAGVAVAAGAGVLAVRARRAGSDDAPTPTGGA